MLYQILKSYFIFFYVYGIFTGIHERHEKYRKNCYAFHYICGFIVCKRTLQRNFYFFKISLA